MSLLLALRAGTRDAHRRLEDRLDVLERCRLPESYTALLQAFRSLHAPLEQALAASPLTAPVVPDWPRRRKTGWLDDDLRRLGAAPPADRRVPPLATAEDVAGACYVVEGATLGGALVVRALTDGAADPPPHRFFASYGAERGAMWARFRRQVSGLDLDEDRSVEAALHTFDCFERAVP